MLIAQISDIHIGFERDDPEEPNVRRLRAVLDRLIGSAHHPDLLLLSGDLTEFGDPASYTRLRSLLAACPFPVRVMCGNHDDRARLAAAFPEMPATDGFAQYVIDLPGLRLIALDTVEAGRHGGAFCDRRAAWLRAQLDADAQTPVVIAMHHPPFRSGIGWIDAGVDEPWTARFAQAVQDRAQVKAIVAGHLHRTIHTQWHGVPVAVCPSSAAAIALDLSPVDPSRPDGRAMVVDEPAGFALHRWDGERLISHFESVPLGSGWPVLARYDASTAGLVRGIARERKP